MGCALSESIGALVFLRAMRGFGRGGIAFPRVIRDNFRRPDAHG